MQGIDLSTTQFIWIMYSTDEKHVQDDPPLSQADLSHLSPEFQEDLEKSAIRRARRYDYYKRIEYIGTLTGDVCVHHWVGDVQMCDGAPVIICAPGMPTSGLYTYPNECSLLARFWEQARLEHGVNNLGGWAISDWLPLLVSKAMQYRIPVPDAFRTDPMKRFNTVDSVLHVDALYSQHSRSPKRPLPDLANVLEWWVAPHTTGIPYPTDAQLHDLDQTGWVRGGCTAASKYLYGMRDIVRMYYGY